MHQEVKVSARCSTALVTTQRRESGPVAWKILTIGHLNSIINIREQDFLIVYKQGKFQMLEIIHPENCEAIKTSCTNETHIAIH